MADWTTSLWGGRIAIDSSAWASDHPVASQLGRQLAQNANHLADAYSQPRVAMPIVTATAGFRAASLPFGASGAAAPEFVASFGPFPLAIREDNKPARLRCRVGGASIKGSGVTFILRVHPAGADPGDGAALTTASTSSRTEAWLTDAGGTNLLTLSSFDAEVARRPRQTRDSISSGAVTSVQWALFEASVYAYGTTIAGQEASLCGLSVAELRGEP